MAKEPKRFEIIHKESEMLATIKIIRDTETGVCYLWRNEGSYGGSITPLLNAVGGVTITGLPERR